MRQFTFLTRVMIKSRAFQIGSIRFGEKFPAYFPSSSLAILHARRCSFGMSRDTRYSLIRDTWPGGGILDVCDATGIRVLCLSIEFLEKGHVLTWVYVQRAASQCVQEEGVVCHQDGSAINSSLRPGAGNYLYRRAGECAGVILTFRQNAPELSQLDGLNTSCTPVKGPRFHYKFRAPTQGSDSGTMSASSVSQLSGNQVSCLPLIIRVKLLILSTLASCSRNSGRLFSDVMLGVSSAETTKPLPAIFYPKAGQR